MKFLKGALYTFVILLLFGQVGCVILAEQAEQRANVPKSKPPYTYKGTPATADLAPGRPLMAIDWHADPLLSYRDLTVTGTYGHVDFPRLRKGKLGLQVFTTVTHQPACFSKGCKPFPNLVGIKHVYGFSPLSTWFSLSGRALWQAEKLRRFAKADGNFRIIRTGRDLETFLTDRRTNQDLIAGLLGVEGLHALEGDPKNVDVFFKAGFRLFGLAHWIDNAFAGSRHGEKAHGLTEKGRALIRAMVKKGMVIDLAHASLPTFKAVVAELKAIGSSGRPVRPVVVSHTGVQGTCPPTRNLTDEEIKLVVETDGVIGVGFWTHAVGPRRGKERKDDCQADLLAEPNRAVASAKAAARAMMHVARITCAIAEPVSPATAGKLAPRCFRHIALGSDFDGYAPIGFDSRGVGLIARVLEMDYKLKPSIIAMIMMGNSLRVLRAALPE
jgi:microsomal dipeptidase-like Zn-dependent dipeptidase